MKSKIILILAFTSLMVGCKQTVKTGSPDDLKKVLFDYFDGIKNRDFEKMYEVTTNDFTLYEDGKIWNNDSIINFVKLYPDSKIDYKFDHFKINMNDSIGNMYYFNHGDFAINDTIKMKIDWVESATFINDGNSWKMNFLHSTTKK